MFQRPDDNEETVANRLKVYEEKTKPLIEFYRDRGVLQSIDAEGDLDEVTQRLEAALRDASVSVFGESKAQMKPAAPVRKARSAKKSASKSAATKRVVGKVAKKSPARRKSRVTSKAAGKPKAASKRKPVRKVAAKAARKNVKRSGAARGKRSKKR